MMKLIIIYMKKLQLLFISILTFTVTHAQQSDVTFIQDTIVRNVLLDEVTVKAPEAIQRGDKKIYFPNSQMKRLSNNALSLLEKLRVNGIQINTLFNRSEEHTSEL